MALLAEMAWVNPVFAKDVVVMVNENMFLEEPERTMDHINRQRGFRIESETRQIHFTS